MTTIRILPEEIVNKLAAGEVVERPASVVKELIENALDAGATSISVRIKKGGKEEIIVEDNGVGIPKDDLPATIVSHATSKIYDISDLYNLRTLGFRGEALSSIASVSRLVIHSRFKKATIGYEFNADSKTIVPKARDVGTTVYVRDLFYNVPARKKFLASDFTETKHIQRLLFSLALAFNKVGFVLINNGKEVVRVLPEQSYKTRLASLLNIEQAKVFEIEASEGPVKLYGVFVYPQPAVEVRKRFQYIYVNKRMVQDNYLRNALIQAFDPFVLEKQYIIGGLFVDVPPQTVDFNVHPRKLEVRFTNPYRVYSVIRDLLKHNLYKALKDHIATKALVLPKSSYSIDMFRQNKPLKSSGDFSQVEYGLYKDKSVSLNDVGGYDLDSPKASFNKGNTPTSFKVPSNDKALQLIKDDEPINQPLQVIQLLNRYILVEWPEEIWLLDQHAAAERITYERLKKQGELDKQGLVKPLQTRVTLSEEKLKELLDVLQSLGFVATYNFKGQILTVTAVPSYIKISEIERTIDYLVRLLEGNIQDEEYNPAKEATLYVFATAACHTSIRAGERLTKEQMLQLIGDLLHCENPNSCPHGRPIIKRFTKRELDNFFQKGR